MVPWGDSETPNREVSGARKYGVPKRLASSWSQPGGARGQSRRVCQFNENTSMLIKLPLLEGSWSCIHFSHKTCFYFELHQVNIQVVKSILFRSIQLQRYWLLLKVIYEWCIWDTSMCSHSSCELWWTRKKIKTWLYIKNIIWPSFRCGKKNLMSGKK